MSLVLPAGSRLQGVTNDGNSVTWQLPGHTVQKPKLAIFKRTVPTYNQNAQKWSDPAYQYKVVFGVVDADGNPVRPNIQIGTEGIKYPMGGVDRAATFAEALASFKALTAGVTADEILSQQFPAFPDTTG